MIVRETKVSRKCKLKGEKCQMSISHDDLADLSNAARSYVRETVASKLRLLPDNTYDEGEFDLQVEEFVAYIQEKAPEVAIEKVVMLKFAEATNREIAERMKA